MNVLRCRGNRNGGKIRIISSRPANQKNRDFYESQKG